MSKRLVVAVVVTIVVSLSMHAGADPRFGGGTAGVGDNSIRVNHQLLETEKAEYEQRIKQLEDRIAALKVRATNAEAEATRVRNLHSTTSAEITKLRKDWLY